MSVAAVEFALEWPPVGSFVLLGESCGVRSVKATPERVELTQVA